MLNCTESQNFPVPSFTLPVLSLASSQVSAFTASQSQSSKSLLNPSFSKAPSPVTPVSHFTSVEIGFIGTPLPGSGFPLGSVVMSAHFAGSSVLSSIPGYATIMFSGIVTSLSGPPPLIPNPLAFLTLTLTAVLIFAHCTPFIPFLLTVTFAFQIPLNIVQSTTSGCRKMLTLLFWSV